MEHTIALTSAGAAALINQWLSIRVGQARGAQKISVGDGGHEPVMRRMRAQSNFIEYTPITLILIALIEMSVGTTMWLWAASGAYLLSRVAHAIGMDNDSKARPIGISITMLIMVGLGIYALVIPYLG